MKASADPCMPQPSTWEHAQHLSKTLLVTLTQRQEDRPNQSIYCRWPRSASSEELHEAGTGEEVGECMGPKGSLWDPAEAGSAELGQGPQKTSFWDFIPRNSTTPGFLACASAGKCSLLPPHTARGKHCEKAGERGRDHLPPCLSVDEGSQHLQSLQGQSCTGAKLWSGNSASEAPWGRITSDQKAQWQHHASKEVTKAVCGYSKLQKPWWHFIQESIAEFLWKLAGFLLIGRSHPQTEKHE